MSPAELFAARLVWHEILQLPDAGLADWRGWAEEIILEIPFPAPYWLGELTVAPTARQAWDAVADGLALEAGDFPQIAVHAPALRFGLVYRSYAHRDDFVLANIEEDADVQLIELFQQGPDVKPAAMPEEQPTVRSFRPVAAHAIRTARAMLRKTRHVRPLLRHRVEDIAQTSNQGSATHTPTARWLPARSGTTQATLRIEGGWMRVDRGGIRLTPRFVSASLSLAWDDVMFVAPLPAGSPGPSGWEAQRGRPVTLEDLRNAPQLRAVDLVLRDRGVVVRSARSFWLRFWLPTLFVCKPLIGSGATPHPGKGWLSLTLDRPWARQNGHEQLKALELFDRFARFDVLVRE